MEKNDSILVLNISEPYEEVNFYNRGPNWSMAEHHHSYYQFIFVIDGLLLFTIGGEEYTLKRGQICVTPPFQPHSLRSTTGYYQFGTNLQTEKDSKGMIGLLDAYLPDFVILDYSDFLDVLPVLEKECRGFTKLSKIKIANILDSVIVACVEMIMNGTEINFKNHLLTFLNKNLNQKIKLSDVAKELAISQSHLERLVRKEFGCGVIDLYNQLRINKACSFLSASYYTIENISELLGFYDPSHFSHFFKQKIKMSPTEYRKHKNWAK
ncbi:AraC-type DNA-binding protein [Paenibacillus sp. 1_12]|uniref:helix-turn-helix domain-containing protein n=1 Tax=Paenibacillus sp. 1_12 TaxID=1566278 RepID=UPI0008EE8D43|nr:AraC family transcriptional regulator [Paenibacillus sp. 1_12]SFK98083.1 AraC-type DNA-binding protein [Paenibacillus sp. 1_12]